MVWFIIWWTQFEHDLIRFDLLLRFLFYCFSYCISIIRVWARFLGFISRIFIRRYCWFSLLMFLMTFHSILISLMWIKHGWRWLIASIRMRSLRFFLVRYFNRLNLWLLEVPRSIRVRSSFGWFLLNFILSYIFWSTGICISSLNRAFNLLRLLCRNFLFRCDWRFLQ